MSSVSPATTSTALKEKCVDGIEPNLAGCEASAEGTLERPVTNQGRLLERGEAHMFQG